MLRYLLRCTQLALKTWIRLLSPPPSYTAISRSPKLKKPPYPKLSLRKFSRDLKWICHKCVSPSRLRMDLTDSTTLQFIDLCLLLGCDYLEPIKGVGPKNALKLIREFGGLKEVVEHLREKYVVLHSCCATFARRSRNTDTLRHPDRLRKRNAQLMPKTAARKRKEVFMSLRNGLGKKRRSCLRNRTCYLPQKSR
jgi:hypothetical protein